MNTRPLVVRVIRHDDVVAADRAAPGPGTGVLSEREQRVLDELERRTALDDPRFAAAMQHRWPTRTDRWLQHAYDASVAAALLTGGLCFALGLVWTGVLAVLLVGAVCSLRPPRHPPFR